jgi:hypothetical protein
MNIEFINDKEWGIDKEAFDPVIKRLQKITPNEQSVSEGQMAMF